MGLRITAERLNMKKPAIFQDPNYDYVNKFILSTSTLGTDSVMLGAFGPVVPNGFGVSLHYLILIEQFTAVV